MTISYPLYLLTIYFHLYIKLLGNIYIAIIQCRWK